MDTVPPFMHRLRLLTHLCSQLKNMWGKTREAAEHSGSAFSLPALKVDCVVSAARSAKGLWTTNSARPPPATTAGPTHPDSQPPLLEGSAPERSRLEEFLFENTLYVLYNPNSGGTHSNLAALLRQMHLTFSPNLQPTDMTDAKALKRVIRRIRRDQSGRVLVIGGDGSIGWVLKLLQPENEPVSPNSPSSSVGSSGTSGGDSDSDSSADTPISQLCPPVAVWPGGTGNDLARVLGWGNQVKLWDFESMIGRLEQVVEADVVLLDQWRLSQYPFGLAEPEKTFTNYLSIGADAAIALNFHQSREAAAARGASEGVKVLENKMKYFASSISVAADKSPPLDSTMELWCDEAPVSLRGIVAIVVLNIGSYGAGADLWGRAPATEGFTQQSISDGVVEVFGFESLAQMGLAQLNQSTGRQLAQGAHLRIQTSTELPWQVDGEPWSQRSCSAEVNALSPVRVLLGTKPTGKSAGRVVAEPLQTSDQPTCKQQ